MKFRPMHGIILVLALGLAGVAYFRLARRPAAAVNTPLAVESLPVLGTVAPFDLIERSGKPKGLTGLKGHIWLADFIFTNCAGPCPLMTATMSRLQTALSRLGEVRFVSISVDPLRDTPEMLRAYADKYGADSLRWWFLTGPMEDIQRLAVDSFKLGSVEDPLIHSTYFVLVDRMGRIRGYYDSVEPDVVAKITLDVERLSREKGP